MFITPSLKKSLIVEQFQGNCLKALCIVWFSNLWHLPASIYEYFFKVEANPVQMRCQCFYSVVMVNSKLDYLHSFSNDTKWKQWLQQKRFHCFNILEESFRRYVLCFNGLFVYYLCSFSIPLKQQYSEQLFSNLTSKRQDFSSSTLEQICRKQRLVRSRYFFFWQVRCVKLSRALYTTYMYKGLHWHL